MRRIRVLQLSLSMLSHNVRLRSVLRVITFMLVEMIPRIANS